MRKAHERIPLPLLAACLMPNHIHLVVRPTEPDQLSRWMHWLFTTHVRHYHAKHETSGRVWQDRYKAFVIEEDAHLLTVLRYVERNSARAGLVARAEHWRWGSLRWRTENPQPVPLTSLPIAIPEDWIDYVNQPLTSAELGAVRRCARRQSPFGSERWASDISARFGYKHVRTRAHRTRAVL